MLTATDLHVRWMIRRDVPAVMAIEQASFGDRAWVLADLLETLSRRDCIGMVAADRSDRVIGFTVYELSRHALEILDLAVHPAVRRTGAGSQIVSKLVGKLSVNRRGVLVVRVPDDNLTGLLFLKANGFRGVAVERHEDGDTVRMEYVVPDWVPGEVA